MPGVIAAGHPVTAQAGADVLRDGGNAVDAAVAAVFASFVAEPLLTGLGAGGYMLVAGQGQEPVLLDFIVEVPGRTAVTQRAPLRAVEVSFGDAAQEFHVGASSAGIYGAPAGIFEANRRYGSVPLAELAAPAIALAERGVEVTAQQAYLFEILAPIISTGAECRAMFFPRGTPPRAGEVLALPDLARGDRIAGRGRTGSLLHRRSGQGCGGGARVLGRCRDGRRPAGL